MKLSDLFINQDVFDFIDDYNTSENHFIHLFQKEIKKLSGFEYYSDNYNAILLFERLVRDILSEREYNSRYSSL